MNKRNRTSRAYQELRELVHIALAAGPKIVRLLPLDVLERSNSQSAILFRGLSRQDVRTEKELAKEVLSLDVSDPRYRVERTRLKRLLVRLAYFLDLDPSKYSPFARKLYRLRQETFVAVALRGLGARLYSETLAVRAIPAAYELEEWGIASELLSILRSAAVSSGDLKRLEGLVDQSEDVDLRRQLELKGEIAIQRVQVEALRSGAEKPALLEGLTEISAALSKAEFRGNTFKLQFLGIRLRALAAQSRADYSSTLQLCGEANALMDSYQLFNNRTRRAEYHLYRLMALVQLGKLDEAAIAIDEASPLIHPNEVNWFSLQEVVFLFEMHRLEFNKASLRADAVRKNGLYPSLSKVHHQRWDLYAMYAQYADGKEITLDSLEQLMDVLPDAGQDKLGFNISIQVLRIMLLLRHRDYNAVMDRIGALQIYRKRYLRSEEGTQAEIFFRLLFILDRAHFDRAKVSVRAVDLTTQLKSSVGERKLGIQILPYTWIWQHILELIQ